MTAVSYISKKSGIGNMAAHGANVLGKVDEVTELEGAVALSGVTGGSAMTIGHYIFGPKNFKADWKDHLFVHEYGHFRQSLRWGSLYLPVIGAPSIISAAGDGYHLGRWTEYNASKLGATYMDRKYGRGKPDYKEGDPNFFDIDYFRLGYDKYHEQKDRNPPYTNPRFVLDNKPYIYNTKAFPMNKDREDNKTNPL